MGELGGHGQVNSKHNQGGAQVGSQELPGEDQAIARVAQTSLQSDGGHSGPGLAGHPQQGVRHQGVAGEGIKIQVSSYLAMALALAQTKHLMKSLLRNVLIKVTGGYWLVYRNLV